VPTKRALQRRGLLNPAGACAPVSQPSSARGAWRARAMTARAAVGGVNRVAAAVYVPPSSAPRRGDYDRGRVGGGGRALVPVRPLRARRRRGGRARERESERRALRRPRCVTVRNETGAPSASAQRRTAAEQRPATARLPTRRHGARDASESTADPPRRRPRRGKRCGCVCVGGCCRPRSGASASATMRGPARRCWGGVLNWAAGHLTRAAGPTTPPRGAQHGRRAIRRTGAASG